MATTLSPDAVRPARRRRLRLRRRAVAPAPATTVTTGRPARPVTTAQLAAGALALVAIVFGGFAAYLTIGARLQAEREQDVMYQRLRADLGAMTVPFSGAIAPGTPLGVLDVPAIGLEQVFVEGSSAAETRSGPGLKPDTVLPGQAGLSVLVGHRSTMGAAFGDLDELAPGDRIRVTTGQGHFEYVVDLVRTSDAPAAKIQVVPSRLTLVTSDPAYTPDRRLVVSARLDGDALPASTGTTASAADAPGEGSRAGLVRLLLWSQLLLLASVAITWTAVKLPGRGLWIGGAPVLLALLWQVYEGLALLLPNTL